MLCQHSTTVCQRTGVQWVSEWNNSKDKFKLSYRYFYETNAYVSFTPYPPLKALKVLMQDQRIFLPRTKSPTIQYVW